MKKIQIFFIYAEECSHCAEALRNIKEAIDECENIPCEVLKYEYSNPIALNIAVKKGIAGLPGIAIGNFALYEDACTKDKIIEAIKKSWISQS